MRQFDYSRLSAKKWDNDIVLLCSKIHECKGRQFVCFIIDEMMTVRCEYIC